MCMNIHMQHVPCRLFNNIVFKSKINGYYSRAVKNNSFDTFNSKSWNSFLMHQSKLKLMTEVLQENESFS